MDVLSVNIIHHIAAVIFVISILIFLPFSSSLQSVLCCDSGWSHRLLHMGVGAGCLLGVGVAILLTEAQLVQFVKSFGLLPRYKKVTKEDTKEDKINNKQK